MLNISYKMKIGDIKKIVYENYMKIAHKYVMSGEYIQNRKNRIFKIFTDGMLYMLINFLLYYKEYVDGISSGYAAFAILMSVLAPVFIFFDIYYQNIYFGKDIKKQCIKGILQDLANIKYLNYKESLNIPNIITDNDIMDLNLAEKFPTKYVDDIFVGDYDNINYNLQEIKLYNSNNALIYEGSILKAILNTNISGWIDVCTNECIEKRMTFKGYFLSYFIVFIILITMYSAPFKIINNFPFIFIGLIVLTAVISYIIAKYSIEKDIIKVNIAKQQHRKSNIEYINEKIIIKTSDNIVNMNDIITTEFIDVIEVLQQLFNTPKIHCKLYGDKVMLAIDTRKNLFEVGGLFTPPTNKKIAEKFISQISGVLLFLDYLNNKNI